MLTTLIKNPTQTPDSAAQSAMPGYQEVYAEVEKTTREGLSPEAIKAFAEELNQLKAEVSAKIGDEDIVYVETVDKVARMCEITGRLLLHFSRDPLSWGLGVLSLWVYLQLDNLEIHHHAQHQAWDKLPRAKRFHSDNYYHNSPVDERAWRYRHNILHHSYTGQIDRDPDVSFGFFRMGEFIDRQYFHKIQPMVLILNALQAAGSLGLVASGLQDYLIRLIPGYRSEDHVAMHGELSFKGFQRSLWQYVRKAAPTAAYNYGLFGLLAGPRRFGQVTLGMLSAELLRNIFTGLTFYTGHMVEGVKHYDTPPKNRAEWYIQQIEGTGNVRADRIVSMLMGHLNYQIEHHLFPKLPPNRLEEISPQVEALCRKYGVRYNTGTFKEQVLSVFKRVAENA